MGIPINPALIEQPSLLYDCIVFTITFSGFFHQRTDDLGLMTSKLKHISYFIFYDSDFSTGCSVLYTENIGVVLSLKFCYYLQINPAKSPPTNCSPQNLWPNTRIFFYRKH